MIYSNASIIEALEEGRIRIEPVPSPPPPHPNTPYSTCSVDLRLGKTIQVPTDELSTAVDLSSGNVVMTLKSMCASWDISQTAFTLDPGRFVLGTTLENVSLPIPSADDVPTLAARIEGRSSFARFGLLVHFTAPTIHAGWNGHITLELYNAGPNPIVLRSGLAICQLIVEEVHGRPYLSVSRFQGQRQPAGPST